MSSIQIDERKAGSDEFAAIDSSAAGIEETRQRLKIEADHLESELINLHYKAMSHGFNVRVKHSYRKSDVDGSEAADIEFYVN